MHYRSTWYLDAWCHQRDRLLRFALDAVQAADVLGIKAKDVALKAVEAELDGGYGIFAGSKALWATLSFDAQAAQWVSREEWHPEQTGRFTDDGRYELQVPYSDEIELVMDILRHGGHVKVVTPPSLRALVCKQLEEALATNAS